MFLSFAAGDRIPKSVKFAHVAIDSPLMQSCSVCALAEVAVSPTVPMRTSEEDATLWIFIRTSSYLNYVFTVKFLNLIMFMLFVFGVKVCL